MKKSEINKVRSVLQNLSLNMVESFVNQTYKNIALKHGVKTTKPNESLLSLVVIFFALWVMFVSQFSNNTEFIDDASQPRVEDVRDFSSDPNAPYETDNDSQLDTFLSLVSCFKMLLAVCLAFVLFNVFPRRHHLNHIRPRSPPL